jgi:MFS family permease
MTILRSMFIVFMLVFITYGFMDALRLPFTIQALRATELTFGLLEGLTLAGFVIASFLMAHLGDRLSEGQWLAISFVGMALTGIVFALVSTVSVAFIIITLVGFLNAPSVIARSLLIQRYTPRKVRGRVFSAFFVMRDAMFLVGMAFAGLADFFNIRALYLGGGLVTLATGVLTLAMPGLGKSVSEWGKAMGLLRSAPDAPGLGIGRAMLLSDFNRLSTLVPQLAQLGHEQQVHLRTQMSVIETSEGTAIVRRGETSDAAYFILEGEAVAGVDKEGTYFIRRSCRQAISSVKSPHSPVSRARRMSSPKNPPSWSRCHPALYAP